MASYLLGSDDATSDDYLSVSRNKSDASYVSVDLFCSSDLSCNEAVTIIKGLISEAAEPPSLTVYDYNGRFVSFCQENGCMQFETIVK